MKRFITRLFAVERADGTVLVTRDVPENPLAHTQPLNYIGPAPVEPPQDPMPREEFDRWEWGLVVEAGYHKVGFAHQPLGLPAVEELEEEEVPDGAEVEVTLGAYAIDGQPRGLLVTVANRGPVAIPKLAVHWVWNSESPQPVRVGGATGFDMGGSVTLVPEKGCYDALGPGQRRRFLLDTEAVAMVSSQVAALSPERYWVAVLCAGHEIGRVPGRVAGAEVEALGGS
jgi:hypothetical protein